MEITRQVYATNRKWAIIGAWSMVLFASFLFILAEVMSYWKPGGDGLMTLFREAHGLIIACSFAISTILSAVVSFALQSIPKKEKVSLVEEEKSESLHQKVRFVFRFSVATCLVASIYHLSGDFVSQNFGAVTCAYCGLVILGVSVYLFKVAEHIKNNHLLSTTTPT